ncbi:MAG: long-chain fatty acid--CoA ligase [Desulfobacteraceae bacterium]|nr:MAG: long-chain fatty acid--CoA ligase [Desulfobacteraceae bacterium]
MTSAYEKRPWLKSYPHWIPHDLKLEPWTALDDFKTSAALRPEAPAVHYFDHSITYGELDKLSNSLSAAFRDLGITKGDRIILVLQNVPQFLIAAYAAWKTGAIVVPLNPMYKEKELAYFMKDSGARLFIAMDEVLSKLDMSFLQDTQVREVIRTSPLDFLPGTLERPAMLKDNQRIPVTGTLNMSDLLEQYRNAGTPDPETKPEDIAYLTYTSGTTGPPKGAINTHGGIAFNARVYQAMAQIDGSDVVLGVAPLFHVTGEVAHLAIAALAGIPVVLYYRFDPGETLRLIERWRATFTVASITVFIALLNHSDIRRRNISSFVKAYSGGAPVSEAVARQFQEVAGLYLYIVYGMTETNSPSHIVPWKTRAPVDPSSGALSVGLPVQNCVVKIMDLEEGNLELPPGDVGEIVDFGPMVTPGYWQKPEETRHAIRNGWLYTGDVGKMDENGWFYVVDRKKDLIVASGFKVWPRDVEDIIYQHPAVRETAVVGVPDGYRGETVKAFVALKEGMEDLVTPDEIIAFCRARMAAYKYPRQVDIVPEIPKTLTGKFLRRRLREIESYEKNKV